MSNKLKLMLIVLLTLSISACSSTAASSPSDSEGPSPTAQEQAQDEPFAPFAGAAAIELLTPTSDAGLKPLFEWSPVENASRYSVFLQFSDGQPYWSWSGAGTSVYLGGYDSAPPDDSAGPVLLDGMSWAVVAFDAQGTVIASSHLQPISP